MRKIESDVEIEEEASPTPPPNVRLFPTFKEIPDPDFPLDSVGLKIYQERCRGLLERGLLTLTAKEAIEMLALAKQGIHKSLSAGKNTTRQDFDMLRAANIRLEKLDVDRDLGEASGQGNIYEAFGFARRERQSRFGK